MMRRYSISDKYKVRGQKVMTYPVKRPETALPLAFTEHKEGKRIGFNRDK